MLPTFLIWFFSLLIFNFSTKTIAFTLGNQSDYLTLLNFKKSISNDPHRILDSWNGSIHFCKWYGITCNTMHQRVTELKLPGYKLHGSLSSHVANLTFLRHVNLADNKFSGKIPQELGQLLQLQELYLTNNSFYGEIPTNLTNCFNLKYLLLSGNNLIGKIPIEIGSLGKLQELNVGRNNLIGGVPPFIGNLSVLTTLSISRNNLEGDIPQEICRLKNLTKIAMGLNKLSGTVPSCLYNMSSLAIFSAAANQIDGSLPPNMFNSLPNLKVFEIGVNQFSGLMPISVANASTLRKLDISSNYFVGQVPNLGRLQYLWRLNLELNNFGENSTKDLIFFKSLTNCSKLQVCSISHNNFGGSLPNLAGNLSIQLSQLYLGSNQIYGQIPSELGNLNSLISLTMENNSFEGTIPDSFWKFQKIQVLDLSENQLSGHIPGFIGNFSQIYYLSLAHNMLGGNIPPSLGNCHNLHHLNLSKNNFRGTIPLEVFSISSLSNSLDLSQNSLSGNLSVEVGRLKNINKLDFSENNLSGEIPITIDQCKSLEYLYLQGNSFYQIIPSSLAYIRGLRYLDMSRNQLSGSIPNILQNISRLEHLNVSFNMLDGEVPKEGVFRNASRLAVFGNNKLCGGISDLHLPPCPFKHNTHLIVVIVSVVAFIIMTMLILAIYYLMRKRNKKPSSDSPIIDQIAMVSYQDLYQATDGFSSRNLIGSGGFGSVYKGNLISEDQVIVVKVLDLEKNGAHKSFITECNVLKNIRHRNLVKILTCCSSIDYKGQEFKALVFDYMKNGSLENWLHSRTSNVEQPRALDLDQRLNIIIDVASALHYLHRECEQLVLHCDLKPSNVLIDEDNVAHVSDFGIARLVSSVDGISPTETSTIGIKGTVGYAPPGMSLNILCFFEFSYLLL